MTPSHSVSVVGLDAGSSRCAALLMLVALLERNFHFAGQGSLIHHPMLVRVSWAATDAVEGSQQGLGPGPPRLHDIVRASKSQRARSARMSLVQYNLPSAE